MLAKMGGVEIVGQFALALAICAPVMMFARLNLRTLQATDAKNEFTFGDYLGLAVVSSTLAMLVISGIIWAAGYRGQTALVILAIGLAKHIENVSDVIFGLFQKHEQMNLIGISQLTKGPLSLISFGVVFFLTNSVLWGSLALAAAWGLILVVYDLPRGIRMIRHSTLDIQDSHSGLNIETEHFGPKWEARVLARMAWLAMPLGIVTLLISLNSNIPRYFIEWHGGEQGQYQLGIFAAIAYMLVLGGRVVVTLSHATSPRLSKYYLVGNRVAFGGLVLKLVGAGAFLGLAGVLGAFLFGPQVLSFLYSAEFAEHVDVLIWMMLAATFLYMSRFLENTLVAIRQIRVQVFLLFTSVIAMMISCIVLVPSFGILGAAWATTIAAIFQFLGYVVVLGYALRFRWTPSNLR